MIDGIEPLYREIAESMIEELEKEGSWTTAWMDAVFYSESILYSAEYIATVGAKLKSVRTNMRGQRAFRQIRNLFKAGGKPLWCRARFELHSDGKFKMNWGYEGCDNKGAATLDENETEEDEIKRNRELGEGLRK